MALTHASYQKTGFPFGFPREDYEASLAHRELADLREERTALAELALDLKDDTRPGGNYAVLALWIKCHDVVIARKERLYDLHAGHPLVPSVEARAVDTDARKIVVKAAWPIEVFCEEVLGAQLRPAGRGELAARCPLPGHDDSTPSFKVNPAKGVAFCHGCGRGGDILALAGFFFGCTRFFDKLETVERLTGINHDQIVRSIHSSKVMKPDGSARFIAGSGSHDRRSRTGLLPPDYCRATRCDGHS